MVPIKRAVALFILFSICTEALGIVDDNVDGALGHGRKFKDSTVQKLGDVDEMAHYEFTDDCCKQCLQVFPATEMVRMIPLIDDCKCYKRINGKRPKTFPDSTFIGTCGNTQVDAILGAGREWQRRIIKELYDYDKNSFLTRITITATEASECCQACKNAEHPTTQLYEFDEEYQTCKCFRKKAGSTPHSFDDTLYDSDVCGSSHEDRIGDPAVIENILEGCFWHHQDFPGMDINLATARTTDRTITAERCQRLCQRNSQCNYFTWSSSNKRCYLKSCYPQSSQLNYEFGATSGPKSCWGPSQNYCKNVFLA